MPLGFVAHGDGQPRVVSLAPAITEMLFALGVGDRLVGVTEYCDYPEAARSIARIGGFSVPNPETILALRPDLIVVSPAPQNKAAVDLLSERGVPIMVVAEPRRVTEIRGVLEALGAQFGRLDVARRLGDSLERRLDTLRDLVAKHERPATLISIQPEPLVVCAPDSYPADLVEIAGGSTVVRSSSRPYPFYSIEAVLRDGPDVLIETFMDIEDPEEAAAASRKRWRRHRSLPAVRDGRVHVLDGDALLRPGPRAPRGAAELVALLHPELAAEARRLAEDPAFLADGPREES